MEDHKRFLLPSKNKMHGESVGLQSLDQKAFDIFTSQCHVELRKSQPCSAVSPEYLRRRCYDRWRDIDEEDRRPFYRMLQEDENRSNREGLEINGSGSNSESEEIKSAKTLGKRRKKKDPDYEGPWNMPKRPVTGFLLFCNEERARMKQDGVQVVSRELGRR